MTVFLAAPRERSSRDGMTHGSLVNYESQKIEKAVPLQPWQNCILSGNVLGYASFSVDCGWTYLVMFRLTRRIIQLPEQKETIHMTSLLRKEACSGSIHDIAHIPTQNCLAECVTKTSAKADNLITVVKAWRLLNVDIHPNFRNTHGAKAFLSTGRRICMQTRGQHVLFLNALKFSLAPTPRERPFHVTCVRNYTCSETQDATTRTSALVDSRIYFSWTMASFGVRTLCLCVALMTIFPKCFTFLFLPAFETMTSSKPMGVGRVIRWTRNSAERFENYYYESLAFSWQTIDLVFDEETMKPGA